MVDSEPGYRLRGRSHSPGAPGDFPALPAAPSWPVEVNDCRAIAEAIESHSHVAFRGREKSLGPVSRALA